MEHKPAVVTGGSRGIGRAIAEALAAKGYEVTVIARSESAVHEVSALAHITGVVADVTDEQSLSAALSQMERIDVLVNAAGVIEPIAPIESVDSAAWLKLLTINVFGTFLATKLCIPALVRSGSGTVVNFVGGGEGAFPNFSAYAASKGAIARFTETAAAELKDRGVTVNAIAPGAVNTGMTDAMVAAGKSAGDQYDRALKQQESADATPEKAVQLVEWLVSEHARATTGRILSAQWDPYRTFPEHQEDINGSDVFTMRRIRPQDRGFTWGL